MVCLDLDHANSSPVPTIFPFGATLLFVQLRTSLPALRYSTSAPQTSFAGRNSLGGRARWLI